MKSSRKFRKLFSRDLLESIYEHVARWRHPVSTRHILATLDRVAVTELRRRYPIGSEFPKINRFADIPYWISINIERAQDLWLHRSRPPA